MPESFSIPIFDKFHDALDFSKHIKVPQDWFVFVADVKNSTDAIRNGRYKQVNLVGAACIMGVLNAVKETDIPFVFGGDGATFLIPPHLKEIAESALAETAEMSLENFGLTLRTGYVPVAQLYEYGYDLNVAKYRLSNLLSQVIISGNGLIGADGMIKNVALKKLTPTSTKTEPTTANYTGLECRWQPLKNTRGEMLSLIVKVTSEDALKVQKTYLELMRFIDSLYGKNPNPIEAGRMRLSSRLRDYVAEAKIVFFADKPFKRFLKLLSIYAISQFSKRILKYVMKARANTYLNELAACSDFRKFDGILRMVIDSSQKQSQKLEGFLENLHKNGDIVFGVHRSKDALLTCLIFERTQANHLHLVDGSDGGYAEAALMMKKQIKALSEKIRKAA